MRSWSIAALLAILVFVSSLVLFEWQGILVFIAVAVTAWLLRRMPWTTVALILVLLFMLVALLTPAVYDAREAGRLATCQNNLKNIGIAILNYESEHHSLPPPFVADKDGKPMHSWRVLILPYLDRRDLYDQYKFDEPWNGPNNRELSKHWPRIFTCPADQHVFANDAGSTSYVAIVGKHPLWRLGAPRKLANLADASSTVMLLEVANSDINWMEPRDFALDDPSSQTAVAPNSTRAIGHIASSGFFLRGATERGASVAFADGHTEFLPADVVNSNEFDSLLTIGGYTDANIRACQQVKRTIRGMNSLAASSGRTVSRQWFGP